MLRSTLSSLRDWREYLTPVSHVSTFRKSGEITPEEFVIAGDYLVYKFPTWSWSSAPASKRRDFLPENKQYLITRHVPSHVRADFVSSLDDSEEQVEDSGDDEGWTSTHVKKRSKESSSNVTKSDEPASSSYNDQIIDIDLEEAGLEDDEDSSDDTYLAHQTDNGNTQAPTRTYNLYITYSTSYRVPKFYLSGFNADGGPLSPTEMFEDIVGEYKDKTVTIEKAPFEEDLTLISIHPCRHANVMKVLLNRVQSTLESAASDNNDAIDISKGITKLGLADNTTDSDEWEEINPSSTSEPDHAIRVDQYLVIFLKFIASVTPGIEHDYTMSAL